MYRYKFNELKKWKESENRKPLIIRGARQVGKTWLMKEFGKKEYEKCAYINFDENNRMIDVYWYSDKKATYSVDIEILANDRSGLLADIIAGVETTKCKLMAVTSRATKEKIALTEITVEVENTEELNKILKQLRKIDSVYEVKRKK